MPDSLRRKTKLIIYADSVECTTCRISRLKTYDELFRLSEEQGSFVVILLLSNVNLNGIPVIRYLSDLEIEHPVYVDDNSEFMDLNPIVPEDRRMHAFLVDQTGAPLCVGDPVSSEKMRQVFLQTVEGHYFNMK